jgi:hypothetical protein
MAAAVCRHDHLPVGNRLISRETVMKIFPAIVLSGALLVAGVAASVSGYSLKSRATAGSETYMSPARASAGSTSGGRIFVGPVLYRTDYCSGDYVCDEYGAWIAIDAAR